MTDIESEAKNLFDLCMSTKAKDAQEVLTGYLTGLLSRYVGALRLAHHELATQNGLWASDESDPIMITGDVVWQLDNGAVIRAINNALSNPQSSRAEAMMKVVEAVRAWAKEYEYPALNEALAAYDALGEK